MSFLIRTLEWYLGLEPSAPGQGRHWELVMTGPFSAPRTFWLTFSCAVAFVIWLYLREGTGLSRRRRALLISLRIASVFIMLVILGQLSLSVAKTNLPNLAVLVDLSGSMSLEDQYPRSQQALAQNLCRVIDDGSPTRLKLAQGLLLHPESRLLEKLQARYKIRLYGFADDLLPIEPSLSKPPSNRNDAQDQAIKELTVRGQATRPGPALLNLLDRLRGTPLSGVVILTDGIATNSRADALSQTVGAARERGVPIFPIGIGSTRPDPDVEIYDLLAGESVYLGEPITLEFRIRGYQTGPCDVTVQLLRAGSAEPLATTTIHILSDNSATTGTLVFVPQTEGLQDLELHAIPLDGEQNVRNNLLTHRLFVHQDPIRVLLVERWPRWEYRALKPLLERDDGVRLHTILQSSDIEYAKEDETALAHFPASEEALSEYDVIIWGDVDLSELSPSSLAAVNSFVEKKGGALVFIAGETNNPWNYFDSDFHNLLPVTPEDQPSFPNPSSGTGPGFRIELTPDGRNWPFFRLGDTPEEDQKVWQSLPPEIQWFAQPLSRKPGAQVLAVHPYRHGTAGRAPLIVHQRYGAGQVLFHATDELWVWRKRVEDRYYGRYWSQLVRAFAKKRPPAKSADGLLMTDQKQYELGTPVNLQFQAPQTAEPNNPSPILVEIESSAGFRQTVELDAGSEQDRTFSAEITHLPIGDFQATVVSGASGTNLPTCQFRIEPARKELMLRTMNQADLIATAEGTHGAFLPFDQTGKLLEKLPRGKPVTLARAQTIPLWNRWEILLLLTGLLAAEWIFRKRSRLV